jgi:hypothetical protein
MSERIQIEIEASHAPMFLPIFRQQRIEVCNSVEDLQGRVSAAMKNLEELHGQLSSATEALNSLDYTINRLSENTMAHEFAEHYVEN